MCRSAACKMRNSSKASPFLNHQARLRTWVKRSITQMDHTRCQAMKAPAHIDGAKPLALSCAQRSQNSRTSDCGHLRRDGQPCATVSEPDLLSEHAQIIRLRNEHFWAKKTSRKSGRVLRQHWTAFQGHHARDFQATLVDQLRENTSRSALLSRLPIQFSPVPTLSSASSRFDWIISLMRSSNVFLVMSL